MSHPRSRRCILASSPVRVLTARSAWGGSIGLPRETCPPSACVCTIIGVMSTQSVCEKCGGTGWIIVERASVSGAERCACRSEGRAERLEERSQIPPLYRNASFENFKTEGVQELKSVMSDVKTLRRRVPARSVPRPAADRRTRHRQDPPRRRRPSPHHAEGLRGRLHGLPDAARPHPRRLRFQFQLLQQGGLPHGARQRSPAARRPGRAPRHRLGAGHRHLDRHPPLQQPEAADRHHQSARCRCRQQHHSEDRGRRRIPPHAARPHRRPRALAPL